MACVDRGADAGLGALLGSVFGAGAGALLSSFISEWLPLLLNVILAVKMLEEQEEQEAKMKAIADISLEAAEELFAAYMALRGNDAAVYSFANSQPLYNIQDHSIFAIAGLKKATAFHKKAASQTSRYHCGERQHIANEALSMAILEVGAERELSHQFEMSIEDSHIENHYDAIASSASVNVPHLLSGAFESSAAIWGQQAQASRENANGAMAGVGYYLGRIF